MNEIGRDAKAKKICKNSFPLEMGLKSRQIRVAAAAVLPHQRSERDRKTRSDYGLEEDRKKPGGEEEEKTGETFKVAHGGDQAAGKTGRRRS